MEPLLEVKNLSISFRTYLGEVQAVRDISFTVGKGETIAIVGESGCGKSVTAQAIMQLLPFPSSKIKEGEIFFKGENLLKKSSAEMEKIRGKDIGMIFQDPMTSLNPTMTIKDQITEGLRKHLHLSADQAKLQAIELLHEVGIGEPEKRIDQYPHQFSGGMRQRAMIAIALACDPKLLIADEPTTALDVTIQAQILDLLKKIQAKKQMSIILITHDLGIVAGMCDRVIVMYSGTIVESATIEDLYGKSFHPYTQGLLRSIPRLDLDKERELIPIRGTPPNLLCPPQGCPFTDRCPHAMRVCFLKSPSLVNITSSQQAACWLKAKEDAGL